MAQAISCVVSPNSAVYISGPITTGKNFIDWYLSHGLALASDKLIYFSRLKADVIQNNEAAILALASAIRSQTEASVIQPASLFIPDWTQPDYIDFWLNIIDRFSKELVMVDGWEYSVGCVSEYKFAKSKGLPIRAQSGAIVNAQEGENLIMNAIKKVEEVAGDDAVLKNLVSALQQAITGK